jgi:protein-disulfide isomerase
MNARIDKDFQLGVKVGVQGTPNFYINGKRQDRFSPDLVEKMLKEAK